MKFSDLTGVLLQHTPFIIARGNLFSRGKFTINSLKFINFMLKLISICQMKC